MTGMTTAKGRVSNATVGDQPAFEMRSQAATLDFSTATMQCTVACDPDNGIWRLNVITPADPRTRGQEMANARALTEAARQALALNKPKRSTVADDTLSSEVRAIIADRGWMYQEAADEFGMQPSALSALLNGHARWTLEAICSVADSAEDPDELSRLVHIYRHVA